VYSFLTKPDYFMRQAYTHTELSPAFCCFYKTLIFTFLIFFMQYKTVQVELKKGNGKGFYGTLELWEYATTRTIVENTQDGWRFVSSFCVPTIRNGYSAANNVYLIFEKA
jgi:Domain of unknown function (DUF4177)